ncbi:hypothetical protein MRS76_24315 [Rhizobiaceae bacterium n13]|uniref:hypothetical protein n=1 Tax=Ferirhizobium litorale TaxID=2927786 RepID=UPI0024B2C049|nr:hypothetical protein [Fererhizobium litorale]MDI7865045.1 hypothetical protein [Fererhizobium litorale]
MSALNALIANGGAHIIVDGAGTMFDKFRAHIHKVYALPNLNAAIGVRGNYNLLQSVFMIAQDFPSQKEMLANLPDRLRYKFKWSSRISQVAYGFDLVIAGVDNDGEPFAKLLASIDRPDQPRFTFVDIPYMWSSPDIEESKLRAMGTSFAANPDVGAIQLVDNQRKHGDVHVGGFVQIMSVTERGITTRVVKRYPDTIGTAIDKNSGLDPVRSAGDWRQ